jgi:hypothetical protein
VLDDRQEKALTAAGVLESELDVALLHVQPKLRHVFARLRHRLADVRTLVAFSRGAESELWAELLVLHAESELARTGSELADMLALSHDAH